MTNHETENREELNDKETTAENEVNVDAKGDEKAGNGPVAENDSTTADEEAQTQASIEGKLKAEIAELNDKYLRLYSEFDNMKRRNAKERIELMDTAGKDILLSFIPVVDDFERAQKAFENSTDIEAVKEGVTLIHTKFLNILSQKGVKAIESKGQPFDVDYHEAITKIPAPTDDLKGKVVDEVEKGYTLKDKVIRFAKVVIGE
ncbi:MAG: nucleotide exchange factor GrpE [Bacteroidetes bacterium]|nr:MAG: nucleotide exchange factor GrpE [Bacteroidota bacterium]